MRKYTDKKVSRILDEVARKISLGYTHDNFIEIGGMLRDLETVLERNEYLFLQDAWRDSYTDSCNEKALAAEIAKIKARLN
jgi:hypothetical protein